MKKIIIYLLTLPVFLTSQNCISTNPDAACCNQLINIDPLNNNQFMVNTERMKSTIPISQRINFANFNLDWINNPTYPLSSQQTTATLMNNPFGQYISNHYSMISNFGPTGIPPGEFNNMHPRYGWQLLYAYNGFYPFTNLALKNNPQIPGSRNGPFLLFYNKYSTKLRMLLYPEGFPSASNLSFELKFVDPSNVNNPNPQGSALFNSHTISQALDDTTTVKGATVLANNHQGAGVPNPNFADMDLDYDPCVCNTQPMLQLNVRFRDSMRLYAEGRFTGIQSPFNNSGVAPYQFGSNFLSSVYTDYTFNNDYSIKNGFMIYNKLDQLAQDYKVTSEMQFLGSMLGMLGSVAGNIPPINIGSQTVQQLQGYIGNFPLGVANPSQIQNIYNSITTHNLSLPVGSALAFGVNKLSSTINPSVPNVSILEGEIALRGTIYNNQTSASFPAVDLAHPGSALSVNPSLQWDKYPYYNEAPGVFALLNKPKFYWKYKSLTGDIANHVTHGIATQFEFGLDKIDYALNPAAEIDLEKSKIFVVLELDMNGHQYTSNDLYSNLRTSIEKHGFQKVKYFPKRYNGNDYNYHTMITAPIHIDKIQNLKFKYDVSISDPNLLGVNFGGWENDWTGFIGSKLNDDIRIKFICDFVYKSNNYGVVNKQTLIYTYDSKNNINAGAPINNNTSCTQPAFCNRLSYSDIFPHVTTNLNTTNYASNAVIYVKDLNILGDITTSNGAIVTIYYSGSVSVHPNASISPNIIIAFNPFLQDIPLNPVSQDFVKNFCISPNYKANKTKSVTSSLVKKKNTFTSFSLYPNPTSSTTTLRIENPLSESAEVLVYDMVGRQVLTQSLRDIKSTKPEFILNTENLGKGLYIVKVMHGDAEQSLKLEIRK